MEVKLKQKQLAMLRRVSPEEEKIIRDQFAEEIDETRRILGVTGEPLGEARSVEPLTRAELDSFHEALVK